MVYSLWLHSDYGGPTTIFYTTSTAHPAPGQGIKCFSSLSDFVICTNLFKNYIDIQQLTYNLAFVG
jgi:hypothetical protein